MRERMMVGIFVSYLTILSTAWVTSIELYEKMIMYHELERIGEEAAVAYFKILF
jgi:hypothetical protein